MLSFLQISAGYMVVAFLFGVWFLVFNLLKTGVLILKWYMIFLPCLCLNLQLHSNLQI